VYPLSSLYCRFSLEPKPQPPPQTRPQSPEHPTCTISLYSLNSFSQIGGLLNTPSPNMDAPQPPHQPTCTISLYSSTLMGPSGDVL
jgi:hypothetical protein